MKGFYQSFRDLPDYILSITKQIWEDRGLDSIPEYYSKDVIVRTPGGLSFGLDNVISSTMATLQEFPDRQLLGEDVIWSGDDETGMLSSHRILSTATHDGDGVFGTATGKKLVYRVLVDCHAKDNKIDDEWLIRDQGAIVRQLGTDPKTYAKQLIEKEGGPDKAVVPLSGINDKPGPYQGTGNDNEWGAKLADILSQMMRGEMSVVPKHYDRAAHLCLPSGINDHGWAAADAFWLGLRSSFPSAEFKIEHQIGREDDQFSPRAAVRWSLSGTHDGWGMFGQPTGAQIYVLGITHAEFGPWGLRREYTLFDETAIFKQIIMQTGEGL